jgi:hypothetical protein
VAINHFFKCGLQLPHRVTGDTGSIDEYKITTKIQKEVGDE